MPGVGLHVLIGVAIGLCTGVDGQHTRVLTLMLSGLLLSPETVGDTGTLSTSSKA